MPKNTERLNFPAILDEIRRRLRTLETAPRLASAAIDWPGRLKIKRQDGSTIAIIGKSETDDSVVVQLRRGDGSVAASLFIPTGQTSETFSIFDANGNEVFGVDTQSGKGMAEPPLPYPLPVATDTALWPWTNNTATTVISRSWPVRKHPKAWVFGQAYAPTGVTGSFTVKVGGTSIGTVTATNNTFTTIDITAPFPAGVALGSAFELSVEARVTAGAGRICAALYNAHGQKS